MESKINVLHVVGTRPVGGIGAMLKSINQRINQNRFNVSYIFADDESTGTFDDEVKQFGATTFVMPGLKLKNFLKYIARLYQFYKNNSSNIDIMHVHSANTGVLDLLLGAIFKIKVRIVHSHSTKYSDSKLKSLRNYFLQLPVKKLSNCYFACSKSAGIFLFGKSNLDKVTLINNAIDTELFLYDPIKREKIRECFNAGNNYVIGHIGSFVEVKNHFFLLKIFKELTSLNQKSRLMLIGSGKMEREIRNKVKELGLVNNVQFLGQRNDIPDLLNMMDAYVLPSLFEGLPVSLIEAQTNGVKCFVSDIVTKEVDITGTIEYLSLNSPAGEWASRIDQFLLKNIREEVKIDVKHCGYDIRNEVLRLENIYKELNANR